MADSKPILLLLADTDGTIEREIVGEALYLLICPDLTTDLSLDQWSRIEFIIASHLFTVTRDLQERCPRLKVIVRLGIGVDSIDIQAASELGVCVCNVPDYGVEEVADATMAHLLGLFRQTTFLHQALQEGEVHHSFTEFTDRAHAARRLRNKTLGLIGMGNIGMAVCYRAKAFGLNVTVYDPYLRAGTDKAMGINMAESIEELIKNSDCVSLHCPLTPQTKDIINKETLKFFRKDAFLVNTSRGGQIVEEALAEALKNGELGGAALDVQCNEPFELKGSPFEGVPNLILTPHAGWYSKESYEDVRSGAAKVVKFGLSHPTDWNKLPNCLNVKTIDKKACAQRWSTTSP